MKSYLSIEAIELKEFCLPTFKNSNVEEECSKIIEKILREKENEKRFYTFRKKVKKTTERVSQKTATDQRL